MSSGAKTIIAIQALYEKNYDWPVLKSGGESNIERRAGDNFGDIECPFCDVVICQETFWLHVGDKCWNCPAYVVRFENTGATDSVPSAPKTTL